MFDTNRSHIGDPFPVVPLFCRNILAMAARRVAKSVVDWAAFAERVPPNQKEAFRALKAKSDMLVSR